MITRLTLALLSTSLLAFNAPVFGQDLLLQYTFDDAENPYADSSAEPAPGTLIMGGSAAGVVTTNTPDGTGGVFFTGNGASNYLTTGTTSGAMDGDVAKLDGLGSFTLTMWVNLQTVSLNDRFVSDGGAPGANPSVPGFDMFVGGPGTGTLSASNFRINFSVDGTSATSTASLNALDQWIFLAITYDGSQTANNLTFYTGTPTSAAGQLGTVLSLNAGPVGDNDRPFRVGSTTQSTSDRTPTGYFDDIRVYEGAGDLNFIEGVRLANVPEPTTATLLLCGFAGAGLRRWRRST